MSTKQLSNHFLRARGIKNKGNTCFFNASMQALLSVPEIVSHYVHGYFDKHSQPFSSELQEFICEYQVAPSVDPKDLISVLKKKINLFNGGQEDAHNFLAAFLHILVDEHKLSKSSNEALSKIEQCFSISGKDLITCQFCHATQEVCSQSLFQFLFISNSVQESLDRFLSDTDIIRKTTPWKCPECDNETEARIDHRIESLSDYLAVYFTRFIDLNNKNNTYLKLNKNLVVNGTTYEIIGCLCHSGSLNSGHYYTFAKRGDMWYEFNDSMISKNQTPQSGETPYIVFYKKKL
ncbi:ubiquitin carboxyl-terminal hydrolase 36/42 [Enteropsectra breve]|nr:ubiquitin carboxyl-terminal hydrolase 36/42 [Enteropsectra breve]